ncbi:MAG: DUF2269 family protein [Pseudomonadota bacterium]
MLRITRSRTASYGLAWNPVNPPSPGLCVTKRLLADVAVRSEHQRIGRLWFWLGVPTFIAMNGIFYLMVFKPLSWR